MKYNVRFFVIILITFCITIAKANDFSSIVYINMDKVMKLDDDNYYALVGCES